MFRQPTIFPRAIQARIIVACCNIHNFIRLYDPDDDSYDDDEDGDYDMDDGEREGAEEVNPEDLAWGIAAEETQCAEARCDELRWQCGEAIKQNFKGKGVSIYNSISTVTCPYKMF